MMEDKLCPPSLSKSSFARNNSSVGTQKGFLGPARVWSNGNVFAVGSLSVKSESHALLVKDNVVRETRHGLFV